MSNTQLVEAIYDFAEHQRLVLGRSEATIKGYTSDLLDLAKSLDDFSSFTLPRLRKWLATAVAEGKARSTLARRTAAAKRSEEHTSAPVTFRSRMPSSA